MEQQIEDTKMRAPLLSMRGIKKNFSGVHALVDGSLDLNHKRWGYIAARRAQYPDTNQQYFLDHARVALVTATSAASLKRAATSRDTAPAWLRLLHSVRAATDR